MEIKEARPTEYKGILYRSKSEAMFARFLEIAIEFKREHWSHLGEAFYRGEFGTASGGFIYEPEGICVDDWTPDFLFWQVFVDSNGIPQQPRLNRTIIEYKPSRPTSAYIDSFVDRVFSLVNTYPNMNFGEWSFRIYFGSVFNQDRGTVTVHNCSAVTVKEYNWMEGVEDLVRATRFDLIATAESGV